jgi:hypothetical protein
MTNEVPSVVDPDDRRTVYSAASDHWIHAEQMRWTILYNFLVGNTILLVAWSTLYSALLQKSSLGVRIVLIGLCVAGFFGSVVWVFLEQRANRFTEQYFQAGLSLEQQLRYLPMSEASPVENARGPFAANDQHRAAGGAIKTHVVVIVVPTAFALIYVLLLVVSIYASAGVI